MSEIENEFNEWKDDTRLDALEKETERLRLINKNQSNKIQNLRKALYFQLFFVVSLFILLFIKGFINLPGKSNTSANTNQELSLLKDSIQLLIASQTTGINDTIYLMGTPPENSLNDVVFSVQIGAFVGKDISRFNSNLTENIRQETYGEINQISIGLFNKYVESAIFLDYIHKMGFKDAFIMAMKNGKKANLQEILATLPPEDKIVPVMRSEKKAAIPQMSDSLKNNPELSSSDTDSLELQ